MGRLLDRCKNIQSCSALRIGHRGQVNECLDRPTPKLLPDPLVLLPYFVVRRVRRPVDAYVAEVFESRFDSAIAPIQGGVEFRLQARNGGTVDEVLDPA